MSQKMICLVAFVLMLGVAGSVSADTFIFDEFDDGDMAFNASGVGSGFEVAVRNEGSVTEADGLATILGGNGGASRSQIGSKESFSANGSTVFGIFSVTDMYRRDSADNGTARFYAGFCSTLPNLLVAPVADSVDGLWIVIHSRYDLTGINTWSTGDGGLVYVNGGVVTELAKWAWDSSVFTFDTASGFRSDRVAVDMIASDLTFVLSSDADGYSLSISSTDGTAVLPDAISGTWAAAGVSNDLSEVYASVWTQGAYSGNEMGLVLDRIVVNEEGWEQRGAEFSFALSPADKEIDVPRDVVLGWKSGKFVPPVNGHIVYLSDNFSDVNDGIGGITQDANSYAPSPRLDLGTTYYWRVDEVNAPPDSTVYPGEVWSFRTEPVGYPIDGNNITATASSLYATDQGPENTINGSGLDANDLHSTEETDMWLSGGEPNAWIEYELDKVHKLHEMWVWNSNQGMELAFGFGLKDVKIEYSTNGTDYTTLAGVPEFAQAPGASDYAYNTTVDFNGVTAKYVRLTANSKWGVFMDQSGLSEVRFFSIPVYAREPDPDSGATDVDVEATLSWRAGRDADTHDVYFSSNEQAVMDGNVPVTTKTEASQDPLSLGLDTTYYWKINEVNMAETTTTWQGEIWNFSTQEYLVVDDFESYNDTWSDGYLTPTTNGALVGYDPAQPPSDPSYMEQTIVYDGDQSMPFSYDNTTADYSEATVNVADLQVGQDWTKHGIKALTLRFFGDSTNAIQQMYVKINGSKVTYDGDADNLRRTRWQMCYIDLASLSMNNVAELSIGFERIGAVGGQGVVYFDAIRLYSRDRQLVTPADAGTDGLVAHWKLDETSGLIAADSSGYGNDGTLTGMIGNEWTTGVLDGALEFDAVDDHISIPVGGPYSTFTVSLWISPASSTESWSTLIGGDDHIIGTRGPADLRWLYYDGESYYADTSVTLDAWNHLAVVRDGSSVTFYLNGVYDGDITVSGDMAFTIIGAWSLGVELFGGLMDDVRIYDRALTQEEAAGLAGWTEPFDKPF